MKKEPIVIVYSFNDSYAELAVVSMTSLLYNTKRNCHIHIFENSVSKDVMNKILKLEEMYSNAKIIFHHIPDDKFEEVADNPNGKETWYPLLAPEILSDLDKSLILEPDTLVCRDISEWFDMDLGDFHVAAARIIFPENTDSVLIAAGRRSWIGASLMLFNLKAIRKNDSFNMCKLAKIVNSVQPLFSNWCNQASYLNYVLKRQHLIIMPVKYNSTFRKNFSRNYLNSEFDFNEIYEAVNEPVIIHFVGEKPNNAKNLTNSYDFRYLKWWEYLALSPFANPEKDKKRLETFIENDLRLRGVALNVQDYKNKCLFDDWLEATEKLKKLSLAGMKIIVYGVGQIGFKFIRFARLMNLKVDKVCDLLMCGLTIDSICIEDPEILIFREGGGMNNTIVVIAIEEPKVWSEILQKLKGAGFAKKHIFPIFEHLAVNGRKWNEIIRSVGV